MSNDDIETRYYWTVQKILREDARRREGKKRAVRREKLVRPRGHRPTDAIRRQERNAATPTNKDETAGTEGQCSKATGPQEDARDKAGRSKTKPHQRTKRVGWSKGNTCNRELGEEYRRTQVRTGTVSLVEGRGDPTRRTRGKDVTRGITRGGGRQNVSVTEEVNHRDGFYKVGCTLISISLRWEPDPKQTPTTPLILNIIYFINPFNNFAS